MSFEFLLVYLGMHATHIETFVRECLAKVLVDNLNEFEDEEIVRMVVPQVQRRGEAVPDAPGAPTGVLQHRTLFGFTLELPDDTVSARLVVDEFAEALNAQPVTHVVKFEDPLLKAEMATWADEIYAIEMKLRRVLSLVYLHAYQDDGHYDLLREETTQPTLKDRPNHEQMKERAENQFFHLTFSQYVELNRRPEFKLAQLLELVRSESAYEQVRAELTRSPVEDENDVVVLAGLKERMDAIEAMRNCCAHSRRPSKRVEQNYVNARPLLDELLDQYLARWEAAQPMEEMLWDCAAREAVESAMERAEWNEAARTITLVDIDEPRLRTTVGGQEELDEALAEVARSAFYANAPREDGAYLFECDEFDVVSSVLSDYAVRITEFFSEPE